VVDHFSQSRKVDSCCCSWGSVCNDIRQAILEHPSTEGYDLWKQPHAQISSSGSEKHKKFVSILKCHLGIKGVDCHATLKIAPHHFWLPLLQFHQASKPMQWVRPLSKEEALEFGNSVHLIDHYPNSKDIFFKHQIFQNLSYSPCYE